MNRINYFILRLKNGLALKYTIVEFFKLILFRHQICWFNNLKPYKPTKTQILKYNDIDIWVISLKRRSDRREKIKIKLLSQNLSFTFFDAIDISEVSFDCLKKYFTPFALANLTSGSIGCILSHISLYKQITQNKKDYAIIFEDDIILVDNFYNKLNNLLTSTPSDFDIIYLSSNHSPNNNLKNRISKSFYSPLYPRSGQYAYLVSKKGANKILNNIKKINISLGGIDTIIGRLITKNTLIAYHVFEKLCLIDYSSPSDIKNYSKPDKKLFKKVII